MAFGDNAMDYADADNAILKKYRLHPAHAQFTRMGSTSKWFRPNVQQLLENRFNFNVWHTPFTGTRQSDFATAATAAFPKAMDIVNQWLSYDYTDLSMFQASLKWSILTAVRTKSRKVAVYEVATQLFNALNADMTEKFNSSIHLNSACQMALIDTVYSAIGGTYSAATTAFFKIKSGSIGNFQKGMVIKTANNEEYTVGGVVYGPDGPEQSTVVADIGPGITVTRIGGGNCTSSADDAITRSGETTGDGYSGLVDWFDPTVNVYNDEDGSAITRTTLGNEWSVPQRFKAADAGSEIELDLDTHLRPVANVMPYRALVGAKNREHGVVMGSASLAITTPELVNQATQEAADNQRWTSSALGSMDAAKRKELFGQVGFEGMVYHSATLGPIAFQDDKAAEPYKIRMLEPSTWRWLFMGKGPDTLSWVPSASGGKIHPVPDSDTTARLTFYVQCAAWCAALLYCEQPGANCEIYGVTDSLGN